MKKKIVLFILIFISLYNAISGESVFRPAKYGDKGENVKLIQEKLIQLNYLNSTASGNYLEQTRRAVLNFQMDNGLEQTGIVDIDTIKKLCEINYRVIKPGENSNAVIQIQTKLIELGYLNTKATGLYKSQTEEAIKSFQKDNDIVPSGIADIQTQEKIQEVYRNKINSNIISVSDGKQYELAMLEFKRPLTRATEGEEVKSVQKRLTELGFFDGPISGYYMNQTISAVKKFQYFNGLNQTGILDKADWDILLNDKDVVDAYSTPAPSPEPVPPKYAVTVDVNNQAVLVYELSEDGTYDNLVKTMICSTGLKSTPSDVGTWITDGRRANWCYFPAYGSHAKYWTKINSYIAFHSVIYKQVDNMALSIKSYNHLGSRASHGCIRLMVHDAKWIYDNIKKGTTITITEDLPYDEELIESIKKPTLNKEKMLPSVTPLPTATPKYSSNSLFDGDFRDLKKRYNGEDVFWLQMKLKELGYYNGTVTGGYYSGTVEAIKKYQQDNNLNVTGIADIDTQKKIYSNILSTPAPIPVITPKKAN